MIFSVRIHLTRFQIRAQADGVHAPADATRMIERAGDQLVERMHQQLTLADRCEERERGDDRLRRVPPFNRLGDAAGREPPQPSSQGTELRRDGRFGERRECAERAQAEQAQTAMDIGIEGQNGNGL